MAKTNQIADELGVRILKRLKGAAVLPVPKGEKTPDGVYLVDREGEKYVLKTGGINPNEIDDNWNLASIGIRTRTIFEAMPGEFVLYDYIDAPVLATLDYWADDKMEKVFALHHRIETELNKEPITEKEAATLVSWVTSRPYTAWLDGTKNNPWTEAEVAEFRAIIDKHKDLWSKPANMERASYDTHAENYLLDGDELVVMDADITIIPKHYTDMRYLAWVIAKMPLGKLSLDWIKNWVERLGEDPPHLFTFFISMLGIMWDIHGSEKHKGEHTDKTEIVKETIYWLKNELSKQEVTNG